MAYTCLLLCSLLFLLPIRQLNRSALALLALLTLCGCLGQVRQALQTHADAVRGAAQVIDVSLQALACGPQAPPACPQAHAVILGETQALRAAADRLVAR